MGRQHIRCIGMDRGHYPRKDRFELETYARVRRNLDGTPERRRERHPRSSAEGRGNGIGDEEALLDRRMEGSETKLEDREKALEEELLKIFSRREGED